MNYTCRNCKYRRSYDCEDYNWGDWGKEACRDRFALDIDTLSPKEKESIVNLAKALTKETVYDGEEAR